MRREGTHGRKRRRIEEGHTIGLCDRVRKSRLISNVHLIKGKKKTKQNSIQRDLLTNLIGNEFVHEENNNTRRLFVARAANALRSFSFFSEKGRDWVGSFASIFYASLFFAHIVSIICLRIHSRFTFPREHRSFRTAFFQR